ncbi:hypothetical protein HDV04_004299 [Boothiomyces sp. JEL0838]|nr:hypothetical protein HDV04_004299 [Boothiomyces sp. JEL0838]
MYSLMKKVAVPKCTTNDYSFLEDAKGVYKPVFKIDCKENKDLYKKIFKEKKLLSKEECESQFNEFKQNYASDRDLLNQERVDELNTCFANVIENMTTYKELIAEIQNEYILVINAMLLKEKEITFLRNKIQNGLSSLATPKQLTDQQKKLSYLKAKYEKALIVKQYYLDEIDHNQVKFAANVAALYDFEVEKWKLKKRNDMIQLGRWHFMKDWMGERKVNDPELQTILDSIEKRPSQFRALMVEDEELAIHDFDSMELKKMKQYVEDQRRNGKNLKKDIEDYSSREEKLLAKINKMNGKIKDVEEIMIPLGGDLLNLEPNERSSVGRRSSTHRPSQKINRNKSISESNEPLNELMKRFSQISSSNKRMSISQPGRRVSMSQPGKRMSVSQAGRRTSLAPPSSGVTVSDRVDPTLKSHMDQTLNNKRTSIDESAPIKGRRSSVIISGPNYFKGNLKTHQQISSELNTMFEEVIGLKPAPDQPLQ